jgi:RNA polymerase I-specific transcription initiation factor RRN7
VPDAALVNTYFPLVDSTHPIMQCADNLSPSPSMSHSVQPDPDTQQLPPGAKIRVYSARDSAGMVPKDFDAILDAAARWTGFPVDDLLFSIELYERRLVHWWRGMQEAVS